MAETVANAKFVITGENQTQRAFNEIKTSMGGVVTSASALKTSLAAIGGAVIGSSLVAFATETIKSAAALDDMAEKTGAAVERLSELQQVARIGGQDFGQVTDLLVKMSRALAGQGSDDETKGVGAALKRIGLSADDLRAKDPADALKTIAVELNKFGDSGGKAALVTALLGKNAAQLLPYLKDLATTSGITAQVTAEQAAKAEELEKAFKRLALESYNAKQSILLGIVPAMINAIEQFNEGKKAAGGFFNALITLGTLNPFKSVGDSLDDLGAKLEGLQKDRARQLSFGAVDVSGLDLAIKTAQQRIEFLKVLKRQDNNGFGDLFGDVKGGVVKGSVSDFTIPTPAKGGSSAQPKIESLIDSLSKEAAKAADLGREYEVLKEIQLGLYGAVTPAQLARVQALTQEVDAAKEVRKAESERTRVEQEGREARAAFAKFADDQLKKENDAVDALRKKYIELADPVQKYRDELVEVEKLYSQNKITFDQWQEATLKINDQIDAVAGIGKELKEVKGVADEVFQKLTSGFEDAIVGGKKFGDAMRVLGQDLLKIFVRSQITEPLGQAFKGALGGGGGSGLGGLIGPIFSGIKGLFGFATGGDFKVGGSGGTDSQLVAFRATPGESVSIRTPGQQQGGGVTVVQNLSFGSDVSQATLAAWAAAVKRQTMDAVAEARQRGGAYSAALGR